MRLSIVNYVIFLRQIIIKNAISAMEISCQGTKPQEILAKYPEAKLIEEASHNQIPELFGFEGLVEDWLWNKKNVLIPETKKN